MQEEKRVSIFGLLIVLIALVLVAVGVMGLLTQDGRMTVIVPGVVRPTTSTTSTTSLDANTAASDVTTGAVGVGPTELQAIPAQATVTVQSAAVRGGSRNKPTAVSQAAPGAAPATGEVMLPGETAPTTRSVDLVNVPGTSAFRVEVLSALYEVSGKPTQGCAAFDNKVPVRRLTLQLAVVNDSGLNFQPGEWGAAAYMGSARATLCFSGVGGLPPFATGTRQPVMFVAFANPDQSVTSVTISTLNGLSARACFEEERVVACPAT
jgi:hypothetical protein